uniref:Uncharacterized protein n=1 Tax=uncultured marine virus TaxID=186617 RepID=A0A0F7L824_9VIRU|nr:hypothetical protein [uncultured marine virus]
MAEPKETTARVWSVSSYSTRALAADSSHREVPRLPVWACAVFARARLMSSLLSFIACPSHLRAGRILGPALDTQRGRGSLCSSRAGIRSLFPSSRGCLRTHRAQERAERRGARDPRRECAASCERTLLGRTTGPTLDGLGRHWINVHSLTRDAAQDCDGIVKSHTVLHAVPSSAEALKGRADALVGRVAADLLDVVLNLEIELFQIHPQHMVAHCVHETLSK